MNILSLLNLTKYSQYIIHRQVLANKKQKTGSGHSIKIVIFNGPNMATQLQKYKRISFMIDKYVVKIEKAIFR